MSDMIDGLSRAAIEAGQDASRNLTAPAALAVMRQQVGAGRRNRRTRAGVIAGGALALGVATAVVVPQLDVGQETLAPADTVRSVVSSVGNLTVFDDGSMSLYTQRGTFVDLPAVARDDQEFRQRSAEEACAMDPSAFEFGWEFHVDEARQVLLFARPQIVHGMLAERRQTSPGEYLGAFTFRGIPYPAFTMDAEVATAPQLAVRETVLDVYEADVEIPGPPVKSFATALDAAPKVTIAGDVDSLNRVATIEARSVGSPYACAKNIDDDLSAAGGNYSIRRYLLADIFLIDREGNSMLLATHTSWTSLEVHP
jgi:hypothetical protein